METTQIFEVFISILTGGVATTLAVQLLKSQFVPFIKAESYPRITAAVVSVVAAVAALVQSGVTWDFVTSTPQILIAVVGGILLVASNVYETVLKRPSNSLESSGVEDEPSQPEPAPEVSEVNVAVAEPEAAEEPSEPANDADETYVVQPGDTITKAAGKLGVSPESLAEANGLEVGSGLDIDQVLKVQR